MFKLRKLLLVAALVWPVSAHAQIAYDNAGASTYAGASTTSGTLSFTTGSGSNRVLYVCISHDQGADNYVDSVTYNSVSMTELYDVAPSPGFVPMVVYRLVAPSAGTFNVSVTFTFSVTANVIAAVSYSGVDQGTPDDGVDAANGENSQPSNTVTSAVNDVVVDCLAAVADMALTEGAGQTERLDQSWASGGGRMGISEEAGAASVTMSWTLATDNNWTDVSLSLNPAAVGGSTSPYRSLTGVGR